MGGFDKGDSSTKLLCNETWYLKYISTCCSDMDF